MLGPFSSRPRQSGLPATAGRSRLCSSGVLLGAALTQPLVLGLPQLGAGKSQSGEERRADWKDGDDFYHLLLPPDALSALVLNSTSFPCAAPNDVPAKQVTGDGWGIHGFAFPH